MSLVVLGHRTGVLELIPALAECHVRIRRFLEIASRLASDPALSFDDIRRGAHDVRRYFAEALPEHIADEELLESMLAGRDPDLDAVFSTMRAEHADHAPAVSALIDECVALERSPESRVDRAPHLAALVARLGTALAAHLDAEERELFPRLAELDPDEREQLRHAIRARRDRALAAS